MSIDNCSVCGDRIDTDFDLDCYVEVGNMKRLHATICLCPRHREEREEAEAARDDADAECFAAAELAGSLA